MRTCFSFMVKCSLNATQEGRSPALNQCSKVLMPLIASYLSALWYTYCTQPVGCRLLIYTSKTALMQPSFSGLLVT